MSQPLQLRMEVLRYSSPSGANVLINFINLEKDRRLQCHCSDVRNLTVLVPEQRENRFFLLLFALRLGLMPEATLYPIFCGVPHLLFL